MSLLNTIGSRIDEINSAPSEANVGIITSVKDGVAIAQGLQAVSYNEIVQIQVRDDKWVTAVAFNLETDSTGLLILEDYSQVAANQKVIGTKQILSIPVEDSILGKAVNPIGQILESGQVLNMSKAQMMPLEKIAPGVMDRQPVVRPLQTGILVVDSLVNVGRGQRELIIGDRQTGKTTIAIDTILNQKGKDMLCVYVAIGQKQSKTKQIIEKLRASGAMDYSVVVSASASDPVSLQYLAPYAGVSIAEYFMDKGKDVLVVYDDLSKHAWAYRQLSLLFRRPPGREAYPGDVFYLHSRLLERAAQLSDEKGGGSITALPIIETQAGDVSAYVPTNVISITDGQIFLESDLFNSGIRPAVNPGISVTRVGGSAQPKNLKKVSGSLKLELAQYRELAAFSKFGGDLDKETEKRLIHGAAATQLLVQKPAKPYALGEEVVIVYAGNKGYLDSLAVKNIEKWLADLVEFVNKFYFDLIIELNKGIWSDDLEAQVKEAIEEFVQSQVKS